MVQYKILKFFGIVVLVTGLLFSVIGIAMFFEKKHENEAGGVLALSLFIASIGWLGLYRTQKKIRHYDQMRLLAGTVRSYRRISIPVLAEKLGVSAERANLLLLQAIALKLVIGNFDRATDEFFTDEAVKEQVSANYCPHCGTPLARVYLTGETIKCSHCGLLIE